MAKNKVMDRPMFKGMMPDEPVMDVENVGIMQGFKDIMADEGEEFDEDYETGAMMGRTPGSPEILMNNLRGDMRSLDARREELADLVGTSAAMETPDSVLAMLQPVLAQQGIGTLPPPPGPMPMGQEMMPPPGMPGAMPPPGMPPPGMLPDMGMPPGMPPGGIAGMPPPVQMAKGGIVQRFSKGSTSAAVTPFGNAANENADSALRVSPETNFSADKILMDLLSRKEEIIPSLPIRAADLSKEYAQLLGSSKEDYSGQAALDLAGLAFSYAANVDPVTGKPMRGSPFARFAQSARVAPGILGKYQAEGRKEDRELKLLGLKGAQAEREAVLERNAKLIDKKLEASLEIAKERNKSRFGKSDFAYDILTTPGMVANWSVGKTDTQQNLLIESALTDLLKPITEDILDPKNNTVVIGRRVKPGTLPPFAKDALTQWGDRQGLSYDQTIQLFTDPRYRANKKAEVAQVTGASAPVEPTETVVSTAPGTGVESSLVDTVTVEKGEDVPIGNNFQKISNTLPGDRLVDRMLKEGLIKEPPQGLFWQFGKIAGPASGIANLITSIPGLGDPYPVVSTARVEAASAQEAMVSALIKGANKGEMEQRRIEQRYRLLPDSFEDPYKLRNRIVEFDREINASIKELQATSVDQTLSREQRRDADMRIQDLQSIRRKLNVPIVANTNKEVEALPEGTIFLWRGTQLNVRRGGR